MIRKTPYLALALFTLAADQISKWAAMEHILRPHITGNPDKMGFVEWLTGNPGILPFTEIPVLPFFNFVMVWNKGVSFGMLKQATDYGPMLLIALSIVITVWFTIWLFSVRTRVQAIGIALVIGGALGNVIDRVRFRAVVDFLDFHAFGWHYPAFNIADSGIVIGVMTLIIYSVFFEKRLS